MEPDFSRHADELLEQLRRKRHQPPATTSPAPAPQWVINGPTGCHFTFYAGGPPAAPAGEDPPA